MCKHEIIIAGVEEIDTKAKEFLSKIGKNRVMAFYGDMGAGKTTFIKGLCNALNVVDEVTSPTFAIVNEYCTSSDIKVFHFDLYRIKKEEEIFDFGYEEYVYSGQYCMIEWPEMAESHIPETALKVFITIDKKGRRILKF